MHSPKRDLDPEIQRTLDRINDVLSVADMTAHHGRSVATARRVLEAQRLIEERRTLLAGGAEPEDWCEWLGALSRMLYPGR